MRAEQITEARKSLGLNQEQFAARLGLDRTTVNRYENGVLTPSATVVKLIEMIAPGTVGAKTPSKRSKKTAA